MFWRPVISPTRRRRRRIAWTIAATLVAVVWVSSTQWGVMWTSSHLYFLQMNGAVAGSVRRDGVPRVPRPEWQFFRVSDFQGPQDRGLDLWLGGGFPRFRERAPGIWTFIVPLWVFLLPMLVPTTRAWLARTSLTLCPRCHYDRAGLAAGVVCPECGTAAPVATPPA